MNDGKDVEKVEGFTCIQCRTSKVKCNKRVPCERCIKYKLHCVSQGRGAGRPRRDDATRAGGGSSSSRRSISTTRGKNSRRRTHPQQQQQQLASMPASSSLSLPQPFLSPSSSYSQQSQDDELSMWMEDDGYGEEEEVEQRSGVLRARGGGGGGSSIESLSLSVRPSINHPHQGHHHYDHMHQQQAQGEYLPSADPTTTVASYSHHPHHHLYHQPYQEQQQLLPQQQLLYDNKPPAVSHQHRGGAAEGGGGGGEVIIEGIGGVGNIQIYQPLRSPHSNSSSSSTMPVPFSQLPPARHPLVPQVGLGGTDYAAGDGRGRRGGLSDLGVRHAGRERGYSAYNSTGRGGLAIGQGGRGSGGLVQVNLEEGVVVGLGGMGGGGGGGGRGSGRLGVGQRGRGRVGLVRSMSDSIRRTEEPGLREEVVVGFGGRGSGSFVGGMVMGEDEGGGGGGGRSSSMYPMKSKEDFEKVLSFLHRPSVAPAPVALSFPPPSLSYESAQHLRIFPSASATSLPLPTPPPATQPFYSQPTHLYQLPPQQQQQNQQSQQQLQLQLQLPQAYREYQQQQQQWQELQQQLQQQRQLQQQQQTMRMRMGGGYVGDQEERGEGGYETSSSVESTLPSSSYRLYSRSTTASGTSTGIYETYGSAEEAFLPRSSSCPPCTRSSTGSASSSSAPSSSSITTTDDSVLRATATTTTATNPTRAISRMESTTSTSQALPAMPEGEKLVDEDSEGMFSDY